MNKTILLLVAVATLTSPTSKAAPDDSIPQLIQAAGNAEDEATRFRLLQDLLQRPDLSPSLRGDLDKLMPIAHDWANGKDHVVVDHTRAAENGYLCRFISSKTKPENQGPVYPPSLSHNSPLRPIWAIYRGRMLIWRVIQSGPLLNVKETRQAYYDEGTRLIAEASNAFPKNRVLRMYLGHPIPWPIRYEPAQDAPEWANLQREGLEKLADLIHWWIDHRQLDDGQFGGGWGDDVEMWRWWTPILIGFHDPKLAAAQERLSSGVFRQPHLTQGFTSRMTDVEHSNEDTTDTILPMMHLRPDDPVWKTRATRLAELMRQRWVGRNHRGQLQFKSIYFNAEKVDDNSARAFDTVYHPSVVQPTLLYWQRTNDSSLTTLFAEWLKLWVDATARAENGKPAGILPSAVHWPDGTIASPHRPWWEPFPANHNDQLYNWPGASRLMTSTLLLAWHMTGDQQYLAPIHSMAAIRLKHQGQSSNAQPGSEAWAAGRISGALSDTLAKYRFLTGDARYDNLLASDASGYVQFRLNAQTKPLVNALRKNAEAFRSNWEAYTAEMRWTDRVMSFTRNYLQYLPNPAPPPPSPEILYSSVTGDPGNPLIFPLNAVRWLTTPRQIAALVTQSDHHQLEAELYHFGQNPRDIGAELYLLRKGQYSVQLIDKKSQQHISRQVLHVVGPRTTLRFQLPPAKTCLLRIVANQIESARQSPSRLPKHRAG